MWCDINLSFNKTWKSFGSWRRSSVPSNEHIHFWQTSIFKPLTIPIWPPRQSWEKKYFKTFYIKLNARRQIFRLYSRSELHLLRGTSMLKISWIDTSLSTKAVLWPPKLSLFFQTEWHMVFLVGERLISLCWLRVHPPASVSEEMDCFGLFARNRKCG